MPRRSLGITSVAFLSVLVAACSRSGKFDAPPGWVGSPMIVGTQKWNPPGDDSQYILIAHPNEARPTTRPASEKWAAIEICGGHSAMLMQHRGVIGGKDVQMDGVDTSWNGSRIMAMYARPYGSPANPAAEKAIRSICSI